jgi:hypothetical protein
MTDVESYRARIDAIADKHFDKAVAERCAAMNRHRIETANAVWRAVSALRAELREVLVREQSDG